MLSINYRDSRPVYEQVRDQIKRLIYGKVLCENDRLPSVRALASELAINPNTIQRAYSELEAEGYIYSVGGKGSFVAELKRDEKKIAALKEDLLTAVRQLTMLGVDSDEIVEFIRKGENA